MRNNERSASALAIIMVLALAIAIATVVSLVSGCGGDDNEQSANDNRIVASGQGVTVEIEPAEGDAISGTVTVSVTESPGGTNMAFFVLEGPGVEDSSGPNMGIDDDDSDGWSIEFDTIGYENGSYRISGLAMESSDSNPLGMATADVTIAN